MSRQMCFVLRAACVSAAALLVASTSHALVGYGVDGNGFLFSFDVDNAGTTDVTIGNLGFTPEGIDFRPSSNTLFAIDVGAVTTQLYTVNIADAVATPVGAGFPSMVGGSYDLTAANSHFGFDFNPSTLQADTSMRIRLVATNTADLRLHSALGTVAVVDGNLLISPGGASPFVDAVAYSNNIANAATMTTTLYDMDSRNNSLYIQSPPNDGTLTLVGPFGATILNSQTNIGFDISTDPTSLANRALAVYKRPDAPAGTEGAFLLYEVDLSTGATTMGRLVGPQASPRNFDGGFSVLPIPEPASATLLAIGLLGLATGRRSWR